MSDITAINDGALRQQTEEKLIHVQESDKFDPVVNIALGIRLLGHKWSQITDLKLKNLRQLIRDFHSRNKEGDEYAEKVFKLYEKSLKKN